MLSDELISSICCDDKNDNPKQVSMEREFEEMLNSFGLVSIHEAIKG